MGVNVLRFYKALLRESEKFPSYNYRNYFIRRIRDAFKQNKFLKEDEIGGELSRAQANLNMIKRQVAVGQMYQTHKLVIEAFPHVNPTETAK